VDSQGRLLPAVNEGVYQGHAEIIAFGVVATFDELLGWRRATARAHEPKATDAPPPPVERAPAPEAEQEARAEVPRPRRKASSAPTPAAARKSDWDD
jgi:hypothetical protein